MAKRGTQAWKMNISRSRGKTNLYERLDLTCPWCQGVGMIENPGYLLRLKRERAGLTQKEFIAISCYARTTIQVVERGERKPPPFLIDEYNRLPMKYSS